MYNSFLQTDRRKSEGFNKAVGLPFQGFQQNNNKTAIVCTGKWKHECTDVLMVEKPYKTNSFPCSCIWLKAITKSHVIKTKLFSM